MSECFGGSEWKEPSTAVTLNRKPVPLYLEAAALTVTARPHPFSLDAVSAVIPWGLTLAEIVGPEALNCRIEIAGMTIPEEDWPSFKPEPGTAIAITRFPLGGGGGTGKLIMRLVAFAALAALTYGIAAAGPLQLMLPEFIQGLSQGAAAAVAAAVGIGGMLVINALIPPASTGVGVSTSPTTLTSITGVQNAADLYGAITCVFGTMLVYPKLAANSFTELLGDDQYLRAMFDLGYGNLNTSAMQIGTNDLANYTAVDYEIGTNPSLYSQDIQEVAAGDTLDTDGLMAVRTTEDGADEISIDLIWPSGLFVVKSNGATETASCKLLVEYQPTSLAGQSSAGPIASIPLISGGTYSEQISAYITINGDGTGAEAVPVITKIGTDPHSGTSYYSITSIKMQSEGSGYTSANTSAVLTVSGYSGGDTAAVIGAPEVAGEGGTWISAVNASNFTTSNDSAVQSGNYVQVSSSDQKPLRVGLRWKPSTSGEYNVRVTRVSSDHQGAATGSYQDALTWSVIRTIRYSIPSSTGTTKLAMRIKATDQLSGTVNQFNLLLSQVIPVYSGGAWTEMETSNPAWVYRWLLKDCPANPRRVSANRIDDATLIEWAADCDANGFTFNYTNSTPTTVFELLKIICAAGRASFTVLDGKYSVVRDIAQAAPIQVFTPRNTAGFEGNRVFTDLVHALRVQFINAEASYQQDEIVVYDDGYDSSNATQFETLQIPGCTDAAMAWKLGRYHLAAARMRPNIYSWTTDIEHLVCNRGDLVLFAHDVVDIGIGWGRVKSVNLGVGGNITSVTVDEPQNLTESADTYIMRFRCQNGSVKTSIVTFVPGESVGSFTLSTPTPGINPGDLFLFGIMGEDSVEMLITKIEPSADLGAKITAVDAAPETLTADAGYTDSHGVYHSGLPTITSSITGQAWLAEPEPPQLIICSSSQDLSIANDSGATAAQIVVTIV